MAIYNVLIHPDKRLRLTAKEVTEFDKNLAEIVANMFETMYHFNGIGLAATQVDIQKRIIVMDVPKHYHNEDEAEEAVAKGEVKESDKLTLINPVIINKSQELSPHEEGCLSLPGQYASVIRPEKVTVRFQDLEGKTHEREADGLLATCIQHEMDHLNGVLFIDHLSRLKRERLEARLKKSLKNKE